MKIFVEKNACAVFERLAHKVVESLYAKHASGNLFYVAFSGGESAKRLFDILLSSEFSSVDWRSARFFWVDERCVPPSDLQSNYGCSKRLFFDKLKIPNSQIHPIDGEMCPIDAAKIYAKTVVLNVPSNGDGTPSFDVVILGAGTDGHIASIFPLSMKLFDASEFYDVGSNPENGSVRVTMTGLPIFAAKKIFMPISGESKRAVFRRALRDVSTGKFSTPLSVLFARARDCSVFSDINTVY